MARPEAAPATPGGARGRRVLFLFSELFADGGIQRFNRTLLAACEQLPLACEVLAFADIAQSAQYVPSGVSTRIRVFGRNRYRFVSAAVRAIASGRYDAIVVGHVHLLGMAAAAATLRAWRRPSLMLVAHGVELWTGVRGLRRRALGAVDRILCVSDFTRATIRAQAPELAAARFALFPNALSNTWMPRRMERAAPAEEQADAALPARFILSVARLTRHDRAKGIVSVIEALSTVEDRDLHYVVAGSGDDVPFLRETAERHGIAHRVHFPGAVSDEHLRALYRTCMAFVLPSGQEGFGIVFLEAMYFGAPVIAAREKGAVDVVQDGETGLLVSYGDVVGLRHAIERLLRDEPLREHLIEGGRASVTNGGRFTFEAFRARCASVLDVPNPGVASVTKLSPLTATLPDS